MYDKQKLERKEERAKYREKVLDILIDIQDQPDWILFSTSWSPLLTPLMRTRTARRRKRRMTTCLGAEAREQTTRRPRQRVRCDHTQTLWLISFYIQRQRHWQRSKWKRPWQWRRENAAYPDKFLISPWIDNMIFIYSLSIDINSQLTAAWPSSSWWGPCWRSRSSCAAPGSSSLPACPGTPRSDPGNHQTWARGNYSGILKAMSRAWLSLLGSASAQCSPTWASCHSRPERLWITFKIQHGL